MQLNWKQLLQLALPTLAMAALNTDTLANFREFMQPPQLRQFLEQVRQELHSAWPPMEDLWQARDWDGVQKGAHRLKSVVGSVGCDGLYQALHALENSLRAQPPRLPGERELDVLRAEVRGAEQALQAFISRP